MSEIYQTVEEADTDLKEWRQIKAWMAVAKDKESQMRVKLAKHFLEGKLERDGSFPEGTTKVLSGSHNVKVVGKLNYTILEELEAAVLAKAQLGPEGAGLIKRKPELAVGVYKKLPANKRLIVDEMLSIKSGSVELTVEEVPAV